MLRNIDKKRIYQEEVYRRKVIAGLDKTDRKKDKGGMWSFVNSAFFLWFLSSVVVGVISFSYAQWDKQREIEREQRERAALVEQENIRRARKLDAEISNRLTYFFYSQDIGGVVTEVEIQEVKVMADGSFVETGVTGSRPGGYGDTEYPVSLSEDGIMSLDNPNASDYKSGDPEYANRSLRLLLIELEAAVPPQEKNEISLALNRFIEVQPKLILTLKKIRELKQEGKPSHVNLDEGTFNKFCEAVNLTRWGVVIPPIQTETAIEEVIVK